MIINGANLSTIFTGYKTAFQNGFTGIESFYKTVAMTVPSTTREETYGWLGQLPKMREWVGDRVIKNLSAHGYKIKNRDFELTISVPRNDIEDDQYGVYAPMFTEMGRSAGEMPDELTFNLLKSGFDQTCYDGQYFFDTDHPVGDEANGGASSVSNFGGGSGAPWFLLDCSKMIRPIIYQERKPLDQLVSKDQENDENVFMRKQFIYGSDGRCNVGFGLWQLAYASKETLNAANYELARAAMMKMKGDEGRVLGIKPTHLVVGPDLEGAALSLLNAATGNAGASNIWKDTAKPIITPWLA